MTTATRDPLIAAALGLRSKRSAADYYDDPVGFADNCISWPEGEGLTDYQREILAAVPVQRRVAVRGPHGLGKTAMQAILVLWFATTREARGVDWKVASTAGAWRQLERYLWPEIHKWSRRLIPEAIGRPALNTRTELLAINLKLEYGQAFAVASDDPALIEGVHADSVLYLFDESKSIVAGTFDAAEGAFSGSGGSTALEAYAVAMSTPGVPNGRFYDIHAKKPGLMDWWARHVTVEETMRAGRVSQEWVDARAAQWGRETGVFHNRVLGEFHSSDEDGVIPLGWIEAAQDRWRQWDEAGRPDLPGVRTVGVDPARFGGDKTAMAIRDGWCITEIRRHQGKDTMEVAGLTKGLLDAEPAREAIVDVIGLGSGVVDRLREQKVKVIAFNAGAGSANKDRSGELGFVNARSEAWWKMREALDPAFASSVMLPDDDDLVGDLTAPKYKVQSGGKIQIESKDEIRKRLGRSTDTGDAVIQAFWDGADHSAEGWAELMRNLSAVSKPTPEPLPEEIVDPRQAARHAAHRMGAYR